jgi:hypothetical protein
MDSDKVLAAIERREALRARYDESICWWVNERLAVGDPVAVFLVQCMDMIENDVRGLLFSLITGETVYLNGSARKALEKLEN